MTKIEFRVTQAVIGIIAVVLILGVIFVSQHGPVWRETVGEQSANTDLKTFTSWNDVKLFLNSSSPSQRGYYGYGGDMAIATMATGAPTAGAVPRQASSAESTSTAQSQTATDFSTTNVQVEGVDEADKMKNDGKYIYTISGGNVVILEAYPASGMKILSTINDSTQFENLFVAGDKLVVFGSDNFNWEPIVIAQQREFGIEPTPAQVEGSEGSGNSGEGQVQIASTGSAQAGVATAQPGTAIAIAPSPGIARPTAIRPDIYPYPYYSASSVVKIYDISNRTSPQLLKTINYKGNYVSSRLIGNKVYLISSESIYYGGIPRPLYAIDGNVRAMQPSEINYFDYPFDNYQFTTILGLDLSDLQKEEQRKVVLMGGSDNVFVSLENAYITFTKYNYFQPMWQIYNTVVVPLMTPTFSEKLNAIDTVDMPEWRKENLKVQVAVDFISTLNQTQQQEIYSEINRGEENASRSYSPVETTSIHKFSLGNVIEYRGEGAVPGHVLNQFAMDENGGYFRIATTVGEVSRVRGETPSKNNLYVLDSALKIVGRLEDLAPGEKIYSARFLGNRAYLVTFKKVDPLFVIGLEDPTNPTLLGKLKIPGYSEYLHPYDETHLIGLGKDAVPAEEGNFAWYQGVKLTMFDVSNVSNPVELATYSIGDRGTDSTALQDHHAFLFSRARNLLVLPIRLAEINEAQYPRGVEPSSYGTFTFQGAYVFNVSLEGFALRGRISHANQEDLSKLGDYYYGYGTDVERSAYIGETLYTISQKWVKANNLQSLTEEGAVQLHFVEQQYGRPITIQ